MNPLFLTLAVEAAQPAKPPAAEQPAAFDLLVSASSAPFQRASSPLRKHKRKAAPQRAALDGVPSTVTDDSGTESELESRASKERRGSASPDPVVSTASAAARSQRPQRAAAAAVQHAPAPAPLAPEDLAAVFDQPAAPAAPPAWLAAAAAPGAPKVCVQCGTTATPMWRQVNGLTYCNADGLRLKRKLGLL
ncbi:GATA factor SREP [Chlorella sorokiniana]|uniref:GATA factor SREP n=1 Tax=Chlorella sorokiniana TaxID=3076 RepID=A0A2P6TJP5_CHLSO|nr:GATA factor SREP [Chlorella sorokiniana]|eukprot:PRW44285.1 GATA factor SREP [Chlorella sorokiniana]